MGLKKMWRKKKGGPVVCSQIYLINQIICRMELKKVGVSRPFECLTQPIDLTWHIHNRNEITEILLKVALNTIKPQPYINSCLQCQFTSQFDFKNLFFILMIYFSFVKFPCKKKQKIVTTFLLSAANFFKTDKISKIS